MERLTWKDESGYYAPKNVTLNVLKKRGEFVDRLAAYEDTGLEPEEIKEQIGWLSPVCFGCEGRNPDFSRSDKCGYERDEFRMCLERSKHLVDLAQVEQQGRLLVLPCKVGDFLYEIDLPEYGVIKCKVLSVDYYNGPFAHVPNNEMVELWSVGVEVVEGHGTGSFYAFEQTDFGKTVFLSREDAEKALEGVSEDA